MGGFSLIHAGFLAAAGAVAVPIVIHLLFRQRARVLTIGSIRFLQQVVREHRRRRRIRQWVLLALRVLCVLLLALLFARPYCDAAFRQGQSLEVVLLIDRSASMSARDDSGTPFARALAGARGELSRIDDNAIVRLALCDAAGVQEIGINELELAKTGVAATDYGLALDWTRDVLTISPRPVRRVHLWCDLQRSGQPKAPLPELPLGTSLLIHDVGQTVSRNLAVDSVQAVRTEIRPDSPLLIRAVIRNHSPLPVKQLAVECELFGGTGKLTSQSNIELTGFGRSVVDFPMPITQDGVYRGRVMFQGNDVLTVDDERWLAFEARRPDRVLLVDGQEGRSVYGNETYYLETALGLQSDQAQAGLRSFETERIVWEAGEGFPRLDGYRVVVLANVRQLSEADGDRIAEFVRAGGALLIFPGDQISATSMKSLSSRNLLPGKLADEPVEHRVRVDSWDHAHPILECFDDPQHGDLRRIEFRKILPLVALAPNARALLRAEDAIVCAEISVGRGRCVYFGSTADRDWTDLPRTRLYVPLMRQLLAWLTDQLSATSPVVNRLAAKSDDELGVVQQGERWQVTNLDPRESTLERTRVEELRRILGALDTDIQQADTSQETAKLMRSLPPDRLRPDELWTMVVWGLLLILVAEMLLASRVHA
jgi:hypothetical protein